MFHEIYFAQNSTVTDDLKFGEPKSKMVQSRSSANMHKLNKSEPQLHRKGSFVVGQKLRESKWFSHEEIKILCAVIETGFIVQRKDANSDIQWGIALWTPGYEKSKNSDYLTIYTTTYQKGMYKVDSYKLLDFWMKETAIKINNQNDEREEAHPEDVIRSQIKHAQKHKQKWHNSQHFTYWCRYGPPTGHQRTRRMSESVKLGNMGLHMGFFLFRGRKKTSSTRT